MHVFHVERPVSFLQGGPSWRDNAGRTTGFRDCTSTRFPFVSTSKSSDGPCTYVRNMHIRWHKCTVRVQSHTMSSLLFPEGLSSIQRSALPTLKFSGTTRRPTFCGVSMEVASSKLLSGPTNCGNGWVAILNCTYWGKICKIWESNFAGLKVGFRVFLCNIYIDLSIPLLGKRVQQTHIQLHTSAI